MSSDKRYYLWIFLSCGEDQGTCFGTLALVSFWGLLVSTLRLVVYTFCHRLFHVLLLSESIVMHNTQSFAPTFSPSFSDRTHSFLCLLPAHHIPPPFCAVMSFHFPSTQLLCSLSMVILVHFPVSCHSLLSAMLSHLLQRRFCAEVERAVSLDISLSDALILWAYCLSTFAVFWVCHRNYVSLTNCHTPQPLNSYIHWRFSLCIHALIFHLFFFFWIQLHGFKYLPNQRQETCKLKKTPVDSHLIT